MNINFKDLLIDDEDRKLFLVDDRPLKAEALRNSILPRLETLLYNIIDEISKVYEIDVYEDSRITKSPNFRKTNRVKPVETDYNSCSVGLTGKFKANKWLGLAKKNGGVCQFTHFGFYMQLSEDEITCVLNIDEGYNLTKETYEIFEGWISNNFLSIYPLIQFAGMKYEIFHSKKCLPFTPLNQYFEWKQKEGIFESSFYKILSYPLDKKQFLDIQKSFVYLFPIYQTFIDLAKGQTTNFDVYLNKIKHHFLNHQGTNDLDKNLDENYNEDNSLDIVNYKAEQKVKVMPGIRWQVFQRDKWKCLSCGRSADDNVILHVDHIIPRSKGGQNELSNYQTLCNLCNIGKSNKDETDIKQTR